MKFFQLVILAFLLSQSLLAQRDTTFWFVAPHISKSFEDKPVRFMISTEDKSATVKISQPANAAFSPILINIPAHSSRNHTFAAYNKVG